MNFLADSKAAGYNISMLIYFAAFMLIFAFLSYYFNKKNINITKRNERIILYVILSFDKIPGKTVQNRRKEVHGK